MKNIFTLPFIISTLALALISCEKEEPVGPDLEDLYGPFKIIDSLSNTQSVDFVTEGSVQFSGSWSTISNWKLEIIGETTGAIKTITGKSTTLDTLIAAWDGTADGIFFKKETCKVQLTFIDNPDTLNSIITIAENHDYSQDGIIVKDFEGAAAEEFWGGNGNNTKLVNKTDAPQGTNYYYLEGTEPGQSYWIGSFAPVSSSALVGTPHLPFNDANASTTYVNFFVRGHGYSSTFVNIQTKIDDNDDGTYADTEGSFSNRYPVTGTEWQKISIPLSELISDSNAEITLSEISKISVIYIMLFSDGIANPKLGCDIDFIILTQGKPL